MQPVKQTDDMYKNVHFRPATYSSLPIQAGGRGCVLYHSFKYWLTGSGQCCALNGTGEDAILVNPLVGSKHWKTMTGKRAFDVKCE
jgi:hypothetical protein